MAGVDTMNERGLSSQTFKILELMEYPSCITDELGQPLYLNQRCSALRREAEAVWQAVQENCRNAAKAADSLFFDLGNNLVKSAVIPGLLPIAVFSQIIPANDRTISDKKRDDLNDRSEDISVRLNKLKLQDCIANSASMIKVFEKAKQVATYPTTVLMVGETGVGKEVIASFIHRNSDRSDKSFIKVNCSAIPEQLLESELFGYESGAFTGAKAKGKPGLFELANNGTLLLDEIGDMALALQAKLLRVLQESEIMRLGGQKTIPLNVRVVSSTNRDIKEMMDKGLFSEALYYRLNVVELRIPPLRERQEDILPLSTFFLSQFCEKYKLDKALSQEVKECLLRYEWPGNVRELRNMIENIVVSSYHDVIGLDDLPQRMIQARTLQAQPQEAAYASMRDAVEDLQKDVVRRALEKHGSLRKAAAALDMDVATLSRLVKKLGISTT